MHAHCSTGYIVVVIFMRVLFGIIVNRYYEVVFGLSHGFGENDCYADQLISNIFCFQPNT